MFVLGGGHGLGNIKKTSESHTADSRKVSSDEDVDLITWRQKPGLSFICLFVTILCWGLAGWAEEVCLKNLTKGLLKFLLKSQVGWRFNNIWISWFISAVCCMYKKSTKYLENIFSFQIEQTFFVMKPIQDVFSHGDAVLRLSGALSSEVWNVPTLPDH